MVRSVSAVALAGALCAFANSASAQGTAPLTETAGQGSEETDQLSDIVVTAQRRAESLQSVPIAVTALTSGDLGRTGATTTEDFAAVVPGFVFTQNLNSVTPVLRGVGSNDNSASAEGSISLYVDGVYLSSTSALAMSLTDVERVEVLRGPQGTLFGRNSTGGAIQIVTRAPTQELRGEFQAGYGNYETFSADMFLSGGLAPNLAGSISGAIRRQDGGWGRNLNTGEKTGILDEEAVRGKLVFEPGPDTKFTFAADYVKARGNRETTRNVVPAWAVSTGESLIGADGVTRFTGNIYDSTVDERYFSDRDAFVRQWGVSLRAEQGLGFADLVSISAYRDNKNLVIIDQDGVAAQIVGASISQFDRTFTQELQLLSPAGSPFKWVVGGYYMNRNAGNDPFRLFSGTTTVLDRLNSQRTRSLAIYAQSTVEVLDGLNLTLGGRYTSDDIRFEGKQIRQLPLPETVIVPTTVIPRKFNKFTFRAAADYQFTDGIMGYVSFNRGFKSGSFNANNSTPTAALPETLDAIEAGIKADFSRRFRVNIAAYHYDYKDLQFQYVVSGVANTVNAAKAKIQGLEIETNWVPLRGLILSGGASISLHSEYTELKPSATSPGCPLNVPRPTGGVGIVFIDCSGTSVARIPDYTLNASAAYQFTLGSIGTIDLSASYLYNDGYKFDPDGLFIQPSYDLVNTKATWTEPNDRFSVSLWAKNLFDKQYFLRVGSSGLAGYEAPAPPRTYGLTARYIF